MAASWPRDVFNRSEAAVFDSKLAPLNDALESSWKALQDEAAGLASDISSTARTAAESLALPSPSSIFGTTTTAEQPAQQQDDSWKLPDPMTLFGGGEPERTSATPAADGVVQTQPAAPPVAGGPGRGFYRGDGNTEATDPGIYRGSADERIDPGIYRGGPAGEIDNSSRESFVRTAYPHALRAADGDPALARQLLATAISENGAVGTGRSLGEMGFNVGGIQGVEGTAGSFTALDAGRPRRFAAYRDLGEGLRAVRDLVSGGRYAQAAATYRQTGDIDRYWREINEAGYSETPDWQDRIASIRRSQVEPFTQDAPRPTAASGRPAAMPQQASRAATGTLDVGGITAAYKDQPYVFGGAGGRSDPRLGVPTDCSGFVAAVWKNEYGIDLPAHTDASYNQLRQLGAPEVAPKDARPGDVVYYMGAGTGGAITHHMGIYAGPGRVLDMSVSGGSGVRERAIDHAGRYVILRDPRINPEQPRRAEEPPPIVPSADSGGVPVSRAEADALALTAAGPTAAAPSSPPPAGTGPSFPAGAGSGDSGMGDMPRLPLGQPVQQLGAGDSSPQPMPGSQGPYDQNPPALPGTTLLPGPSRTNPVPNGQEIIDREVEAQMYRAPLLPTDPEASTGAPYDPRDADQGAREWRPSAADATPTGAAPSSITPSTAPATSASGSTLASSGASGDEYRDDSGPREALPGSVGAGPVGPLYGPEPVAPPSAIQAAQNARAGLADQEDLAPRPGIVERATAPAAAVYGPAIAEANETQDAIAARNREKFGEFAQAAAVPLETINRAVSVANAVLLATPQATADTIDAALSAVGLDRQNLGIDVPVLGRIGVADIIDVGPFTAIGMGRASAAFPSRGVAAGIESAAGAGIEAAGRGLRAVGSRVSDALERNAANVAAADADDGVRLLGSGMVPEDGARRMYHGTAGAFERPDPKAFNENGLYGPGYYLTDNPEVASAYAQVRAPSSRRSLESLTQQAERLRAELQNPDVRPDLRNAYEIALQNLEGRISQLSSGSGPNVRAVDVPSGLRLLDEDAVLDPSELQRIANVAGDALFGERGVRDFLDYATDSGARTPTVAQMHHALATAALDYGYTAATSRQAANEILAMAGYDGITHAGGAIRATGAVDPSLAHTAVVIFPESLDRIRNAFSGEAGGSGFIPGASTLRNAAQGALLGAYGEELNADREGREVDPTKRLVNAVGVAGLGVLAGNRAARGAVMRATREAGSGLVPEQFGSPYPPIRGDVRGVVREQLGEASSEMLADSRFPREAVHPDLRAAGIGPEITPQVDTSGRLNAGFGLIPDGESRRMYHGTAGAFGRPDPGKFDPNGLFGPGYYITSDPRVASSYAVDKGGRANGSMGVTAAGLTFKTPESAAEVLAIRRKGLAEMEAQLAAMADDPPRIYGGGPKYDLQRRIEGQKRGISELEWAVEKLSGVTSGPNIRAVDVPEGLNLLDMEGELDPFMVGRTIMSKLGSRQRRAVAAALENAEYTENEALRAIDVYDALASVLGKDGANRILRRSGYDGITHTGGSVMPIMDADGNPIAHNVNVIFPESLDRIRNAFSGEVGGAAFGVVPPARTADPLSAVNRVLGQGVMSGVSGTATGLVNQELHPDDPNAFGTGFVAGAVAPPLLGRAGRAAARRMGRSTALEGGARIGLGDVPPSKVREPALPGMEPPPTRIEYAGNPDVSEAPNRPPVLGDVPPSAIRQGGLPGLEAPAPRPIGEVAEAVALTPEQRQALPQDVQRALSGSERRRAQMEARGIQPLSPLQWMGEAIKSVGYSSMIGPSTATVNVLGNLLEPLWSIPKEATRAIARGNPREFVEMTMGAWHGFLQTGREMVNAIKAQGRYASNPDQPRLSERTINPVGHAFATATEAGGRLFSGLPDAFFGTIARGAGEAREAAQIATGEGLKGADWKRRVQQLLTEVEQHRAGELTLSPEHVDRIVAAGEAYADRQTFRDQLGTWGKGASKVAGRDVPVVGTFLTPFFTTPWNMNLRMLERTPAGALMNSQKTRFDKAYDATVGSALIAGLVVGPAAAGQITGSGPADPEKRKMLEAEGWKPYHTLVGDTYVPNRTFGIYGRLLNAVGDAHDALAYQKKDATVREQITDAGKRVGRLVKEEPYLQGLADVLAIFDNAGSGLEGFAASNIARLVPYGATARTIGTALDRNERQPDRGNGVPMTESIGQRAQASLGARQGLPVAQDVLGRPRENQQQGIWSVLPRLSQRRVEPLIRAYREAGIDIGAAPDEVSGVKLTPAQQRRYAQVMGAELQRLAGPSVTGGTWQATPPQTRKILLETFQDTARTLAEVAVSTEGGQRFNDDRTKAIIDKAMGH